MLQSFGQVELTEKEDSKTKKVAILETVDKEDVVSYGVKLMVRSSLSEAITATEGYEGYDRVDMSSIMGEQTFQRTGMVSDDQIKRLGEMTGASYVLVTEVALIDANNIIITSKILNVETAKLENVAYVQTATDVDAMDNACRELADKLFEIRKDNSRDNSDDVKKDIKENIDQNSIDYNSMDQDIVLYLPKPIFKPSEDYKLDVKFDGEKLGSFYCSDGFHFRIKDPEPGKHKVTIGTWIFSFHTFKINTKKKKYYEFKMREWNYNGKVSVSFSLKE